VLLASLKGTEKTAPVTLASGGLVTYDKSSCVTSQ
jgi:hypothetical protein